MLISFEPLTRRSYLFNRACNGIPSPISIHARYVRRVSFFFFLFFINANCSKTKAESFIQWQPVAWQQSTFTILWSLEGIKSNYRSGFSIVRNESLYTLLRIGRLFPRKEPPETVSGFRGRLYNPFHSSCWKNLFQLLHGVRYFNFRSLCWDLKIRFFRNEFSSLSLSFFYLFGGFRRYWKLKLRNWIRTGGLDLKLFNFDNFNFSSFRHFI